MKQILEAKKKAKAKVKQLTSKTSQINQLNAIQRLGVHIERTGEVGVAVSCPEDVYKYYDVLKTIDVEYGIIVLLDDNNYIIGDVVVAQGTVNFHLLPFRDVVKWVLLTGATAIILIHNHPTAGEAAFSQSDVEATHCLEKVLESVDTILVDSIVISWDDHATFYGKERYEFEPEPELGQKEKGGDDGQGKACAIA